MYMERHTGNLPIFGGFLCCTMISRFVKQSLGVQPVPARGSIVVRASYAILTSLLLTTAQRANAPGSKLHAA